MEKINVFKIIIMALSLIGIYYGIFLVKDYFKEKKNGNIESEGTVLGFGVVGVIVNFLDTLGIGSFAPTTAIFKNYKMVNDRVLPGTLNVALCLPIIAQALIFIDSVTVDPITLISMVAAACVGSIVGAKHVINFSEKKVQKVMSVTLFLVAIIILAGKVNLMPVGGNETGLVGMKLFLGILGNFILGILMTMGVGLYAPCMALVYSLGMDPKVAFPIMMASCAFLMPIASLKFIKEGAYNKKGSLIINITGIFGVIVAAYIVKSLNLSFLLWIVAGAIMYTAVKLHFDSKK